MLNVKIILGSTRPGRFSELLVPWLSEQLGKRSELSFEVLDLREHNLPVFDQAVSPAYVADGAYEHESVRAWGAKIAEADAYIIVAPEYNHGYTAVLKNALDVVYKEWNRKPVAFVAYGSVGGARAVEQLRQVAVELHLASTRTGVHINTPWLLKDADGVLKPDALAPYSDTLNTLLDELTWWGNALKTARS